MSVVKFDFADPICFPLELLKTEYWRSLANFGIHKNKSIINYSTDGLAFDDVLDALTIILQSSGNYDGLFTYNIVSYSTRNLYLRNKIKFSTLSANKNIIKLLDEWGFVKLLSYFISEERLSKCTPYKKIVVRSNCFTNDLVNNYKHYGFADNCIVKSNTFYNYSQIAEKLTDVEKIKLKSNIDSIDPQIMEILSNNDMTEGLELALKLYS
jgi:hypothetical protein